MPTKASENSPGFSTISIQAYGRTLQALEAGTGPLVIALHGFPDLPVTFRHQISWLAAHGYRVVAPFLRGYSPSDPPDEGPFEVAMLVQDLLALIDRLADGPVRLIGHDWGAAVVRGAAIMAPEKIDRVVTIAVPSAGNFARALLTNPLQQRRSWYMYFFQLPMAEMALAHGDFAFIDQLWQDWSPGWQCPEHIMAEIKSAFRQPAMLQAALGYYRSQLNPALQMSELAYIRTRLTEPIPVPTMHLHGADDGCIGMETTEGMECAFTSHFEVHIMAGAGHFLHQEQPGRVNNLIGSFFCRPLNRR